jgi:cupin 2 domain-containing protein
MPDPTNIYKDIPTELPEELFTILAAAGSVRIERIVSLGHCSPEGFWYDQETDEWVLLMRGTARLRFEGDDDSVVLRPGDFVQIPARRRHRVDWTDPNQPTIWLAVHYAVDPKDGN